MNHWPKFVLLLCAGVLGIALVQLFTIRYEAGDIYPEYSCLRSDPLGTMILFESLERLGTLTVKRDFSEANELPDGKQTTYLHLASPTSEWTTVPEEAVKEIERFLRNGGRLAITFLPENSAFGWTTASGPSAPGSKRAKGQQPKKTVVSPLQQMLEVEVGRVSFSANELKSNGVQVVNQSVLKLPPSLDWHSAIVFTNAGSAWETIYARGTNAVVMERKFGEGSVVIASDSYFVSNESLRKGRHTDLLAWFIGQQAKQVVFDEAHLGIVESPNVTILMRKYHLEGMLAALLLLALLFVWKNASSFSPVPAASNPGGLLPAKESADGLVNLLRRNVAPRDLLGLCFEEWTKSIGAGSNYSIARVDRAQSVIEAENKRAQTERDPVRVYRDIYRVLEGHQPAQSPGATPPNQHVL